MVVRGSSFESQTGWWWRHLCYKGGPVCSKYRGLTLLALPKKVYPRVLDRRIWLMVEPQMEQYSFYSVFGTLDQLYNLHRVLKAPWEASQPVHM